MFLEDRHFKGATAGQAFSAAAKGRQLAVLFRGFIQAPVTVHTLQGSFYGAVLQKLVVFYVVDLSIVIKPLSLETSK